MADEILDNETSVEDTNSDSILLTVKHGIGLKDEYDAFDSNLILQINSALSVLNQLGVGPESGFRITGASETWTEFMGAVSYLEMVKDYVTLKVRHIFDPPASSSVMKAVESEISMLEWRINVAIENPPEPESAG